MYAHNHPLEDGTLVLEISAAEALAIHGSILEDELRDATNDQVLSILEAFHAGTLGDRYARPDETDEEADGTDYGDGSWRELRS